MKNHSEEVVKELALLNAELNKRLTVLEDPMNKKRTQRLQYRHRNQ